MKNALLVTAFLALIGLCVTATHATEGVSPGATDRMAQINNACPTFSWGEEDGAAAYELVAYVLPEDAAQTAELTAEAEVLYSRVPGGATSWTPAADQCFAPGGRYVWFVRGVNEFAGDQVIEASDWSAARYFTVPAAPGPEEVARAIEVMRWLEASGGSGASIDSSRTNTVSTSVADSDAGAGHSTGTGKTKSVRTAPAAIRGEHPSLSGEAYGVVGFSSAPDGAGVAAAHLDGGPDLVLDGSAEGATDTQIFEWGMYRNSPSDQSFLFRNPGAGDFLLDVQGTISTVDLLCPSCVDSTDVDFNYAGGTSKGGPASNLACTGCVAASELSTTGGTTGKVLKHSGTAVVWADDEDGGLTLPFQAWANTGISEPVFSISSTGSGWAIHGEASNNNGVVGESGSGSGVYGVNNSETGSYVGVTGMTRSNLGFGVYGSGDGSALNATGVWGKSTGGTGVLGTTYRSYGVRGEVTLGHGVSGITGGNDADNNLDGSGVYGETTGHGAGVRGVTSYSAAAGVRGENGSNWAELGRSDFAVKAYASGGVTGAYLESASGYGVHAVSAGSGLTGAALYADTDGSAGIAIRANNDSTDATIVGGNSGTGDLIKLFATNNLRFRVTNDGEVSADGAFTPGGADFAELLPARDEFMEPGDVLAISADGRLMKSRMAYQASVVGVYSTKPGVLGGTPADGNREGLVPLAVVGVVPVKACAENGRVRPGDMLVASSVPGHAMRAGDRAPNGRVIGKALSGLNQGEGVITMLVILQ